MSTIVRIGTHQLTAARVCQHLSTSQFLPQLLREIVIDEALAQWQPSTQPQLAEGDTRVDGWDIVDGELTPIEGINGPGGMVIAARDVKLQEFKQEVWGAKLGSYYLSRKSQLDRIVCSVMQVENEETAQELFFRVQSGGKSFAELAFKYSQGAEARDGGKLGPIPVASLHPEIYRQVLHLEPGQLSSLFIIAPFYMFVRLEELIPARFDDDLRGFLLDELFEKWVQDRIRTEIGLVSIKTDPLPLSFMSDKPIFPEEPMARQIRSSNYQIPTESAIPPDFDREQFTAERGDTGLLLSQLDDLLSMSPSTDGVQSDSASSSEDSTPPSPYSIPSFVEPQNKISSSDIEDIDRNSNQKKWLLALAMGITALIGGISVSAYMDSSFREATPINSPTQLK
jgi:PPIC-type PPIASE domain